MPGTCNYVSTASAPTSSPTVNQRKPAAQPSNHNNSSTYNSTTQRDTANRNSRQHDDITNCSTSISRRNSTRHIPTLPITISHGKHRFHAYAMLDCGSKLTLLKSSIALQLKPDLQLDDTIQLNQALTSSDTASTKMTIAIGP